MSDFIERSKAIQAIYWNVMECNNIEMAESVLKDVPSVDTVKHGHWGEEWFGHENKIVCSVCGCFADKWTDYCPNCGAKMDEVTK